MAQKRSPKSSKQALQPQLDPRAPVDSKLLLQHLTRLMKTLEADLLARADGSKGLTEALQARHAHDVAAERTADAYDPWRRGVVTQVAAAWVLNLVFVRVLEDRGLVDQNRIAGPGAEGSQGEFLKLAPFLTERDYLLTVFRELSHFEVTRELFDPKRNLGFRITPSAEGAKALLQVFRQGSAEAPSFRFGQADTRFLGDLYQDLSESVRKKYALLQTPDFIEAFILDRTLDPALESYGLDATTLIDPTCGSGHFLLGAFDRLFDRHLRERPNQNPREAAQKALGAVFGVDINPYAVSIAKFRLMLAFLDKAGLTKLSGAPEVPLNVVVADSLFHQVAGEHPGQTDFGYRPGQKTRDWFDEAFALEEDEKAKAILGRGFAAVVGNPPYIVVQDKALNAAYRQRYRSCHRSYSLAAPFAERFFQLCRQGGYTGMITANSFMKREFGKVLIQEVLARLDLQLIVNTSGAYIPGHGTPTVLLFGQNRAPIRQTIRAIMAKRGEPSTPDEPANGLVWSSIASHWRKTGFEDEYISVAEPERASLAKHPWSLSGGGAAELKELLEDRAPKRLGDIVESIGRTTVVGEDDVWIHPPGSLRRHQLEDYELSLVLGERVRDWSVAECPSVIYPYIGIGGEPVLADHPLVSWLWPWRELLARRTVFGKEMRASGRSWWEHLEHYTSKLRTPLSITFAFVATHNHFVLDRGGKVFNRSAPIIKLPESATEDDHYALLAYLNSSTACFLLKQVSQVKQMTAGDSVRISELAQVPREFSGTGVASVALPPSFQSRASELAGFGRTLEGLSIELQRHHPKHLMERAAVEPSKLSVEIRAAVGRQQQILAKLVAAQEDLDWYVYSLFELVERGESLSPCGVGERPCDIAFGESRDRTENMDGFPIRIKSDPVAQWRLNAIRSSRWLALLETPDFKRRWIGGQGKFNHGVKTPSEEIAQVALNSWLDSLEASFSPATVPLSAETFLCSAPQRALDVAATALGADSARLGREAMQRESIPYLSALRYTGIGVEKQAQWLKTWDLQRREDAGQAVGPIAVPPKYKPEDFKHAAYWSLRGKLDVPKERFIGYPGCESDEDPSPVYGWAGWNHLERARALAALYDARKEEGWKPERLLPMLVGLLELLPWLKQYHNAPDEAVGGERPAEEFEAFIAGELRQAGKTAQEAEREVLAWAQAGGAKSRSAAARRRAVTEMDEGEPESGTRSSDPPDAVDDASRDRSSPAGRLRKTRPRDTGTTGEHDTDEPQKSGSAARSRAAAAGAGSPRPRPPTSPASKRKKG